MDLVDLRSDLRVRRPQLGLRHEQRPLEQGFALREFSLSPRYLALQRKILQGLEIREKTEGTRHVHRAAELIDAAVENLERAEIGFHRIVPAGDLRRGGELVSGLAVVAETEVVVVLLEVL